jgi:hypothetical protein
VCVCVCVCVRASTRARFGGGGRGAYTQENFNRFVPVLFSGSEKGT